MGIGVALVLWLTGVVLGWIFSGVIGGGLSFIFMVMAFPVMPILGMPAAGGGTRMLVAIGASATLWWVLGQVVAARVARRPVVGWREWLKDFTTMGLGLWIGAALAMGLGALILGAL